MITKEELAGVRFSRGYTLDRFLGQGGFGSVYLGKYHYDDSLIAVKVFGPYEHRQDAVAVKDEAQAHAHLRHHNIVPTYWHDVQKINEVVEDEAGQQKKVGYGYFPYIVMHYASEGSLDQYIQKKGSKLSTAESVDVLVQAADGLQYAHDKRVLHRDVKPGNFLVDKVNDGDRLDIMVTDFGVAVRAYTSREDKPTDFEMPVGTTPYMAPEQFYPNGAIIASDIYGLGVVAFELLTGRRPYDEKDADSYRSAHAFKAVPRFREAAKSDMNLVLERLDDVVHKALSKKPEDRFGSIGDFGQKLRDTYEAAKVEQDRARVIFDQYVKSAEVQAARTIEIQEHLTRLNTDMHSALEISLLLYEEAVQLDGYGKHSEAETARVKADLYGLLTPVENLSTLRDVAAETLARIAERLRTHIDNPEIMQDPHLAGIVNYIRGILHQFPVAQRFDHVTTESGSDDRLIALGFFDRAIANDEGFVPAYYRKGMMLQQLGRLAEAEVIFQQADAMLHGEQYQGIGIQPEDLQRKPELKTAVEVSRRLMVKCAEVEEYKTAGDIALELGDATVAKDMIDALMAKKHFYKAGDLALRLGDAAKAERCLDLLSDGGYYYQAGELAVKIGETEFAREMLRQMATKRDGDPYANMYDISPVEHLYGFSKDEEDAYCLNQSARGELAIKLGYNTTVQRVLGILEEHEWYKRTADLAVQFGDEKTARRMMGILEGMQLISPTVDVALQLDDYTTAKRLQPQVLSDRNLHGLTGNGITRYDYLLLDQYTHFDTSISLHPLVSFYKRAIEHGDRKDAQSFIDIAYTGEHAELAKHQLPYAVGQIALLLGEQDVVYESIRILEDQSRTDVYKAGYAGELALGLLERAQAA